MSRHGGELKCTYFCFVFLNRMYCVVQEQENTLTTSSSENSANLDQWWGESMWSNISLNHSRKFWPKYLVNGAQVRVQVFGPLVIGLGPCSEAKGLQIEVTKYCRFGSILHNCCISSPATVLWLVAMHESHPCNKMRNQLIFFFFRFFSCFP